jgi:hypothetical protein
MDATTTHPEGRALLAAAIQFTLAHEQPLTDDERQVLRQLLGDQRHLDSLTARVREAGLGEEQLDDLVDAAVDQYASTVNSTGLGAQLAMLLAALGRERTTRVLDNLIEETTNSRVRVGASR